MQHEQTALDLEAGRAARDDGIARVTTHADEADRDDVEEAIDRLAATGRPFTADDVRELIPPVDQPNLIGACFRAASTRGEIVKLGYRQSAAPSRHANPNTVWRGITQARSST